METPKHRTEGSTSDYVCACSTQVNAESCLLLFGESSGQKTHTRSSLQEGTAGETSPRWQSNLPSGAAARGPPVPPRLPQAFASPTRQKRSTVYINFLPQNMELWLGNKEVLIMKQVHDVYLVQTAPRPAIHFPQHSLNCPTLSPRAQDFASWSNRDAPPPPVGGTNEAQPRYIG